MDIYGVRLLMQFVIENESRKFYEESVRLVHAESFDDALKKAEKIAENENLEYTNIQGKKVTFKIYGSVEAFVIYDKISFEDGAEVFSTVFEINDTEDDPIKKCFSSCSADDMYILRNIEFNADSGKDKQS